MPELPASQKGPITSSAPAKPNADANAPKTTETGSVKSATGDTVKAGESVKKEGVITGDKTSPTANTPTTAKMAEEKKAEEAKKSPALEKSSTFSIKGVLTSGDRFHLEVKRGSKTLLITIPTETTQMAVTLDNTFKIISAIQDAKNEQELEDKFAAFLQA